MVTTGYLIIAIVLNAAMLFGGIIDKLFGTAEIYAVNIQTGFEFLFVREDDFGNYVVIMDKKETTITSVGFKLVAR